MVKVHTCTCNCTFPSSILKAVMYNSGGLSNSYTRRPGMQSIFLVLQCVFSGRGSYNIHMYLYLYEVDNSIYGAN